MLQISAGPQHAEELHPSAVPRLPVLSLPVDEAEHVFKCLLALPFYMIVILLKRLHLSCAQNDKRVRFLSCKLHCLKGVHELVGVRQASRHKPFPSGICHSAVALPKYPRHADAAKPLSLLPTTCHLTAQPLGSASVSPPSTMDKVCLPSSQLLQHHVGCVSGLSHKACLLSHVSSCLSKVLNCPLSSERL